MGSNCAMVDYTAAIYKHAIQRAKERYGLTLTIRDCVAIARQIQHGQNDHTVWLGKLPARGKGARSVFRIHYNGVWLIAIYSNRLKNVLTFYTLEMLLRNFGEDIHGTNIENLTPRTKSKTQGKTILLANREYVSRSKNA